MKDYIQLLINPIRIRIIQYIVIKKRVTSNDILEYIKDVPQTTLYRHLKILKENDLIKIVDEKRIRGTVERTYELNLETLSKENTNENAARNAFSFLIKIYTDFERYFRDIAPNQKIEKVFLSNFNLLLSDEEFNDFLSEMNILISKRLSYMPNDIRKQRNLSFISSPIINLKE